MHATSSGLAGVPPEESIQRTAGQTRPANIRVEAHIADLDRFTVGALVETHRTALKAAGNPQTPIVGFIGRTGRCGASHGDVVDETAANEAEQGVEVCGED